MWAKEANMDHREFSRTHKAAAQSTPQLLEKFGLCAASAVLSAAATWGVQRWRQNNQRIAPAEPDSRPSAGSGSRSSADLFKSSSGSNANAAQVASRGDASVIHLQEELRAVTKEKRDAERRLQQSLESSSGVTKQLADISHHLTSQKRQMDALKKALSTAEDEKAKALAQVHEGDRRVAEAERQVQEAQAETGSLERRLEAQAGERRTAERRLKEMEVKLSSIVAAKARQDKDTAARLQDMEKQVAASTQARQAAEAELARMKEKAGSIQRKVEAHGSEVSARLGELEAAQKDRVGAHQQLAAERERAHALSEQLSAAKLQQRRTEGELKIANENMKRMQDRMRGVLKERTEMESQLKQRMEPPRQRVSQ